MDFLQTEPFEAAVERLRSKSPIRAKLNTREWADVPLGLRERAFFSAGVENANILTAMQRRLDAALSLAGDGEEPFMDRSRFVDEMRGILGTRRSGSKSVANLGSRRRLELIYDFNTEDAFSYGRWKTGQDPDLLDEFPAQELVRIESRRVPREWLKRWTAAGGILFKGRMIATKDDPVWRNISRFGRPWPPFDFGSGMGLREIDRDEAEELGVIAEGETVTSDEQTFNEELEASTDNLTPEAESMLRQSFGEQAVFEDGRVRWTGIPASTRTAALPVPGKVEPAPKLKPVRERMAEARAIANSVPAETQLRLQSLRDELLDLQKKPLKGTDDFWRIVQIERELPTLTAATQEQLRKAFEIPVQSRGIVKVTGKAATRGIKDIAAAGEKIVQRFVAPALMPSIGYKTLRKGSRAFYRHRTRVVHLATDDKATVAAHEIGHAVEMQNPAVLSSAVAFLRRRAGDERPKSLRLLTQHEYKPNELAFEDDWVNRGGDHYMGKNYYGDATELISMGLERLNNDPLGFLQQDPEYLEFLLTTLQQGGNL